MQVPQSLLLLSLSLLLSHQALAADYGQLCHTAEECRTEEAPYCQYFFTDDTYKYNTQSRGWSKPANETRPRKFGLCVQCITDCDCGVNEYCAVDTKNPVIIPHNLTSNNTGNGLTPGRRLRMMVYAKQFEGLPLRSTCKKYKLPRSNCDASLDKSAYVMSVQTTLPVSSAVDQTRIEYFESRGVPAGWPKEAEDRFCGKINSWAPAFYNVTTIGDEVDKFIVSNKVYQNSSAMSTGSLYNTPATCVPHVAFRDLSACSSCQYESENCVSHTDKFCCKPGETWDENKRECPQFETSYRSCEEACKPPIPLDGHTYTSAFCDALQTTTTRKSDEDTFCNCLRTCKDCVKTYKGCTDGATQGECRPCTAPSSPASSPPSPPSGAAVTDGYTCNPVAVTAESSSATPPSWRTTAPETYCQPSCVDCLVAAARTCSKNGTCADTTLKIEAKPNCSTTGEFNHVDEDGSFSFSFVSPPIDFEGHCSQTNCLVCLDGQERCESGGIHKGPRQICINNEWVSWSDKAIGQPSVDVSSRALIAIAVFTAFTFVAGILIAMTVIQHKPAPQQMYLPAPQPEKLVGSPEMMVQDPAGGYVQPAYVPTVANGQLGQYA